MSNAGALAKDHVEWLDGFSGNLDETDCLFIQELLVRTPAVNVSYLSEGFVERYSVFSLDGAVALRELLTDGVDICNNVSSAESLKGVLTTNDLLLNEFWNRGEFIVMTINTPEKVEEKLTESIRKSKAGLADRRISSIKKEFRWLDSLFRHLRNSMAHGQFRRVEANFGAAYIFQDANADKNISARIVLSEKRLRQWVTELRRLEKVGV